MRLFNRWRSDRAIIRRLCLAPNDILVVEVPGRLAAEQVEQIRTRVQEATDHQRTLVTSDGISLSVVEARNA